jgi:hypothetical protein
MIVKQAVEEIFTSHAADTLPVLSNYTLQGNFTPLFY